MAFAATASCEGLAAPSAQQRRLPRRLVWRALLTLRTSAPSAPRACSRRAQRTALSRCAARPGLTPQPAPSGPQSGGGRGLAHGQPLLRAWLPAWGGRRQPTWQSGDGSSTRRQPRRRCGSAGPTRRGWLPPGKARRGPSRFGWWRAGLPRRRTWLGEAVAGAHRALPPCWSRARMLAPPGRLPQRRPARPPPRSPPATRRAGESSRCRQGCRPATGWR
mmetsp:Transcript_7847/g.31001  ORF Transcript_7847/g.31001 Transcript_7847/m.31001 type:complete len:219 (+) Transcript_7847:1117-1773(+)